MVCPCWGFSRWSGWHGLAAVSRTFVESLLVHPTVLAIVDAVLQPRQPMAPEKLVERSELPVSVAPLEDGSTQLVWDADAHHCHHYTAGACVMLETGPYPPELQMRIAGPGGHLSNEECVELAGQAAGGRLTTLILSHLSGENNSPEVACEAAGSLAGKGVEVHLAWRTEASRTFTLGV